MNWQYNYETKNIEIPCPNCGADVPYDVPAIIDAINLGNWLECPDCKDVFEIKVDLPDPRSPVVQSEQDSAEEIEHTGIPETCNHPDCIRLFQTSKSKDR